MSAFGQNIRPFVESELRLAAEAESGGNAAKAFANLERAHVLGQASTAQHVRVHWHMFTWGLRNQNVRECFGQVMRIVGGGNENSLRSGAYGKHRRFQHQSVQAAARSARTRCNHSQSSGSR